MTRYNDSIFHVIDKNGVALGRGKPLDAALYDAVEHVAKWGHTVTVADKHDNVVYEVEPDRRWTAENGTWPAIVHVMRSASVSVPVAREP